MGSAQRERAGCGQGLPGWLPEPVRLYLAHTEAGESIRALARAQGAHPSTVLRQVRRTETLRDDPLADAGLARLGRQVRAAGQSPDQSPAQDPAPMTAHAPDDATLARETLRVLRALMEPKTILVVADGVEDAVVVHDAGGDRPVRRLVVGRAVAESLALRELIAGKVTGRISRYAITAAGRAEAGRLMAEAESRRAAAAANPEAAGAVVEAGDLFGGAPRRGPARARRPVGADAPLHVLARRRRADGAAFLPPDLVAAALRFRESWEIAQIGAGAAGRDWSALLAGRVAVPGGRPVGGPTRRLEAERSLAAAIRVLGPDLAETLLRGVCQEEGMEEIEDRLDFPARSGKIVLRIALRRLAQHYAEVGSEGYDMIG